MKNCILTQWERAIYLTRTGGATRKNFKNQVQEVGKYANIKLTLKTTKDIIKIKLEKSGDKNFIQDNYKIEVIDIKNRKVEIEQ